MDDPINYVKCGEIYWNEKFQVNCFHCNKYFTKILGFLNHVLDKHIKVDNSGILDQFLSKDKDNFDFVKSEDNLFLNDSFQTDDDNLPVCDEIFAENLEINDRTKVDLSAVETCENNKEAAFDEINTSESSIVKSHKDKKNKKKEKLSNRIQRKTIRGSRLRNRTRNKLNSLNKTTIESSEVKKKRIRQKVTCEICGKIKNKHQMKTHLKSHDKSRYIFKCMECIKSFISQKSLELHQKSFHIADGRQFNCTYESCKRKFVSLSLLKEHLKSHINPTDRPFKCHLCPDKGFLYEKKLNTHIKIYHVNGKSLKCDECDRTFYLEYNLSRHKLVHKNKVKPFECDQCPSRFVSSQNLVRHKKNHTDFKEYLCEICKKEFAYFQAYRAHMKYHGIICSIDPKKGAAKSSESN